MSFSSTGKSGDKDGRGNDENQNHQNWDNDTYGHSPDESLFKRKNEPDEKHIEKLRYPSDEENVEASKELKNLNISNGDISGNSAENEKGIGGKTL